MRNARELLRLLTAALPPPAGRHHGILLYDDGKLHVMLHLGETWKDVVLDEEDLDKDPEVAAAEIVAISASHH